MYEPRYYERAAQRHLVGLLTVPLFINVPWGLEGSLPTRPELDGIFIEERRIVPVEVKAHVLTETDLEAIVSKYRNLGFRRFVVVAPGLAKGAGRVARTVPTVDLIVYRPNLEDIRDWYETHLLTNTPRWVSDTLATGRHHIRFVLARSTGQGRFVIGQQRARVYDQATVLDLMRRLPWPPARVLWTPQRFTVPRDLIARGSRVTPLGGFVPVDIDGDAGHRAHHACELSQPNVTCELCEQYARRELNSLSHLLDKPPIAALSSGGRGLHAYYPDTTGLRQELLTAVRAHKLHIDENVTASLKATVAIPGSLNAGYMRPVVPAGMDDSHRLEVAACS